MPRILIVEDEWLIAETLQDTLSSAGYCICGPASREVDAMALIETGGIDGAVLDVSLRGTPSFEIARLLAEKSIPFLFMTGYVAADFPGAFKNWPVLNKPFDDASLISSVDHMVGFVRNSPKNQLDG